MRGALERFARRAWSGEGGPFADAATVAARPLSWCFEAAVRVRNGRYDRGEPAVVEGIEVVSVGNLAVGGTGKTPLARWVVAELVRLGRTPALVSRGFADEVALHRRWHPDVAVYASPDRVAGVRAAKGGGADVAVLDDAFQHRRIHRHLDVVVLAAEDPFPGRLLPAGPYREPPAALGRADVIVVTRRSAPRARAEDVARMARGFAPRAVIAVARFDVGEWTTLSGEPASAPDGCVVAVAGIARPELFLQTLRAVHDEAPRLIAFADHHAYARADIARIARAGEGCTIVMTEKDAVKLAPASEALAGARVLAQELRWEAEGEAVSAALSALSEDPA